MAILIHKQKLKAKTEQNSTAYNTDNMGKLFVTLFAFAPALKTNL